MADGHIGDLGAATTPLSGTDKLIVEQSGVAKQVAVDDLAVSSLIETGSFSSVNAIDIDLPDGYDTFEVQIKITTSTAADIYFKITTDGFSTVEEGASDYDYVHFRQAGGSTGGGADGAHTNVVYCGSTTVSVETIRMIIMNAKDAAKTRIEFHGEYYLSGVPARVAGIGTYTATTSVDGVRAYTSNGNNVSGIYKVYGR